MRKISEIMRELECRFCGAQPGEGCTTSSGRPCSMHSTRWWDAKPLWLSRVTET